MSKKRIGILTSGGDCPGLNAVIRGAVKASNQMGYDCVGFLKGYEGLYDPVQYVHLTPDSTRGILNQGGTILGSTNKGRFAATVGVADRLELAPELIEGVKATIDQLGIDGLICVGGDGSLAVAQQFHEQGIPVVGVPKTIDNDLSATAFTFGFDSAIDCATDALDRLHTTAASHDRIMVLEVMGRHAGWIALHAGIAGGGDIILIPEIEWNYDHVCHKILHRESQGKKFTLVVVAEGAELPCGSLVGEQRAGQQMKLGGVGQAVATEIEKRLHRETRLSVLGHLQRGGQPTTFDRVLATQFGAHAVRLVHEGRFGEMICSQPPEMNSVPITEAVNELRRVNANGPAVQAARALGISFGDRTVDSVDQNVFDRSDSMTPVSNDAEAAEPRHREPPTNEQIDEICRINDRHASADSLGGKVSEPADDALDGVAETMFDLVAEADEAIHGELFVGDEEPETIDEEEAPEPEKPETDEFDDAALADEIEKETQVNAESQALPEPEGPVTPDFSAAKAHLVEQLAKAASQSTTKRNEPIDDAALVKQALAEIAEIEEDPSDEEQVVAARSALEDALAK